MWKSALTVKGPWSSRESTQSRSRGDLHSPRRADWLDKTCVRSRFRVNFFHEAKATLKACWQLNDTVNVLLTRRAISNSLGRERAVNRRRWCCKRRPRTTPDRERTYVCTVARFVNFSRSSRAHICYQVASCLCRSNSAAQFYPRHWSKGSPRPTQWRRSKEFSYFRYHSTLLWFTNFSDLQRDSQKFHVYRLLARRKM